MYNDKILTMIKILTDADSGTADQGTAIKEALEAAKSLKSEAIGEDNLQRTYKCKLDMCGKETCILKIPCILADPTLCMGTGKTGMAKFEETSRDPYKT